MFYLRYLRNELVRRRGRTILTLLGLGLGVALVIAIASLSAGLNRAQKKTLDPLGGIGTDLTVTLTPQQNQGGFQRGPGGGGGGGRDLIAANQSVITDLSKLGKPGTHFVHDFFLPGSQLTFQQTAAKQVAALANVAQVTSGLTLLAEHQEGVVPKIVAKLKTGGQTFRIQRNIPTADGRAVRGDAGLHRQAARQERWRFRRQWRTRWLRRRRQSRSQRIRAVPACGPAPPAYAVHDTAANAAPGAEPAADEHHDRLVHDRRRRPDAAGDGRRHDRSGHEGPLPRAGRRQGSARIRDLRREAQAEGRLETRSQRHLVRDRRSWSRRRSAARAQTSTCRSSSCRRWPARRDSPTSSSCAPPSSSKVGAVEAAIKKALPQAQVASSKQVADKISGSLVDASNLSHDSGLVLSIVAAAAAFLLAALLALSSVGKRVRELGTLKALGWTQRMVVRQIAGESLAQGAVGGLVGIVLGVVAALAISAFGPTLTASATTGGGSALLGADSVRTATSAVSLTAPVGVTVLLIGFALALMGGLIAGAAGALRAARLRPADALRQME